MGQKRTHLQVSGMSSVMAMSFSSKDTTPSLSQWHHHGLRGGHLSFSTHLSNYTENTEGIPGPPMFVLWALIISAPSMEGQAWGSHIAPLHRPGPGVCYPV